MRAPFEYHRKRRRWPRVVLVSLVLFGLGCFALGREAERFANRRTGAVPSATRAALKLHEESTIVADLHADSLLWGRDLTKRATYGHVDLPRLRDGGIGLQVFTIVTSFPAGANISRTDPRTPDLITLLAVTNGWPLRTWSSMLERTLFQARRFDEMAARDPKVVPIRARRDLEELLQRHGADHQVVGALLGIEGAHALEGDPANLEKVEAAGVRLIGLAHFFDNDFAGSAHGIEKGGLTAKGRALVAAMERRRVIVDLAHSSEATIRDVLAMATRRPMVSHTGVRATCDNPRNLSDEQLRAVAAKGGIVGIGFWETAVCGKGAIAIARAIHHAVDVVGEHRVAFGSDFDGGVATPFDASSIAAVTQALLDEGLAEGSIRRILGENVVEFLRATLPE